MPCLGCTRQGRLALSQILVALAVPASSLCAVRRMISLRWSQEAVVGCAAGQILPCRATGVAGRAVTWPRVLLVLLAAPRGWLGWAEVLAGIYVFYYTCYFSHRSNKSALWETPSDSIRSTEIGFSHLCSPGHCCPKRWIRAPRHSLR